MNNKSEFVECHFANSFAADRIKKTNHRRHRHRLPIFSFTWTRYKLAMTAKMNCAKINWVKI